MPALGVTSPVVLALLAAIVPIVWSGWRSREERPRALAAAACRAGAVAAVVLCLAGLHVVHLRPAAGACVVALVDVSSSVSQGGTTLAREFLRSLRSLLGPDDMLGSVAFAGRPSVVAHPAHGPHDVDALVPAALEARGLEPDDTNIAAAVARAAPLCPEGRQAALVLFSDGQETTGSVTAELALAPTRVAVHAVAPPPATAPPAAVRRVIHPAIVPARSTVPIDVVVEAHQRVTAALQLEAGGERMRPLPLDLPPGLTIVALPLQFAETGARVVAARLLPPAAAEAAALPAPPGEAVTVTRPLRILLVSEREAPVVGAALDGSGLDVETVPPGGLAPRLPRIDAYHLVVLDDVASARLERPTLDALLAWVARGGGLVVTGGPHLFGDPGFVGSPLERVLPVTLQSQKPEPKKRDPIAIYVIIDRSNSMGYATSVPPIRAGEKMEYAKRAALAVLEQLGPSDLVGAIAFDAQPYQLGVLQPLARGGPPLVARIRALQYGGGTDFKDALQTALAELVASPSRIRHVILLTDGDTNRHANDHVDLIGDYARAGVSITAVRIGADAANLELLQRIARETGGEFHHVESLQALPQIMIRDAQRRVDMAADRRDSVARFGTPGPILAGLREDELPPVARWAVTRQKPGAELRLYVERDGRREPILATWQFGLGRVAALPLDFQAGAAGWAAWPGFPTLLAELAAWAAPAGLPSEYRLRARHEAAGTRVDLETLGDQPGPFALRLPRRRAIELRPAGARRFAALVPHLAPGRVRALVRVGDTTRRATLIVPPRTTGREHRMLGTNDALLARVTAATGGLVSPTPTQVITAAPGTAHATWPLATVLIPLALVLTLADVALRL
jgi:Mg-chelatase subunit ChlD